ncbi:hypothetical protein [Aquimarina algiphila]|uniref:hypothetical protein n=1 Tax=Aquimarina algiphila TaxID=2047982 RepID=UPI00232DA053|nr:hypothetical protein [Aquimarina algiphila]
MKYIFILLCLPLLANTTMSCKNDDDRASDMTPDIDANATAEIVSVVVSGDENSYSFNVGIKSPDTGCNQYADWWEVISEDGKLLYRRILAHSHVNEQPFVRSGGSVAISKDQIVYVRAHMNTSGYGTKVFKGNVSQGFVESVLDKTFATELETTQPLPDGCAF